MGGTADVVEMDIPTDPDKLLPILAVQDLIRLAKSQGSFYLGGGREKDLYAHLYSSLCEANLDGQFFSGEYIRVVSSAKCFLQFLKLEGGKGGSVSSLLSHLGNALLVCSAHLRSRVGSWGDTGGDGGEVGRAPAGTSLHDVLVSGVLCFWRGGSLSQAHDVGDQERLGTGLGPREVCRGGLGLPTPPASDCSALQAGGGYLQHGGPAREMSVSSMIIFALQ